MNEPTEFDMEKLEKSLLELGAAFNSIVEPIVERIEAIFSTPSFHEWLQYLEPPTPSTPLLDYDPVNFVDEISQIAQEWLAERNTIG